MPKHLEYSYSGVYKYPSLFKKYYGTLSNVLYSDDSAYALEQNFLYLGL